MSLRECQPLPSPKGETSAKRQLQKHSRFSREVYPAFFSGGVRGFPRQLISSQPSLPSEGWGLGVRVDRMHAESPIPQSRKGETRR